MNLFGLLVPRWAAIAAGSALLALALWLSIRAYGNARYDAGVQATDRAWKDAAERLKAQSVKAGEDADLEAAVRAADYATRLEQEKGKVDAAVQSGDSPLDVLFGGGVRDDPRSGPASPGSR